jgi:hypothetical protein
MWAGGGGSGGRTPRQVVEQEVTLNLNPDLGTSDAAIRPLEEPKSPPAILPSVSPPSHGLMKQLDDSTLSKSAPRSSSASGLDALGTAGSLAADVESAGVLPKMVTPGPPGAVETKFFDTPARGTKFVYVIDRSASMLQALAIAKRELNASLEQLPPNAEFQIVLYDLDAQPLEIHGQRGLLKASQENKLRAFQLLEIVRPEGGTDHVKGLKRGLLLAPDVIYYLTDADELRPQQVVELTSLNQRGSNARIHCIELSSTQLGQSDTPMRRLARQNRGEYRGIDLARRR